MSKVGIKQDIGKPGTPGRPKGKIRRLVFKGQQDGFKFTDLTT